MPAGREPESVDGINPGHDPDVRECSECGGCGGREPEKDADGYDLPLDYGPDPEMVVARMDETIPWWPGVKVANSDSKVCNGTIDVVQVFFFGMQEHYWIRKDEALPFLENRQLV